MHLRDASRGKNKSISVTSYTVWILPWVQRSRKWFLSEGVTKLILYVGKIIPQVGTWPICKEQIEKRLKLEKLVKFLYLSKHRCGSQIWLTLLMVYCEYRNSLMTSVTLTQTQCKYFTFISLLLLMDSSYSSPR